MNYMLRKPASGITRVERLCIYLFVLVGKLLLALLVLAAGTGVLLHSPTDYDLVLNTLAAEFVLNVDEMAYILFVSPTVRSSSAAHSTISSKRLLPIFTPPYTRETTTATPTAFSLVRQPRRRCPPCASPSSSYAFRIFFLSVTRYAVML